MKINVQPQLNNYTMLDDREYTHYRNSTRIKKYNKIKGRNNYKQFVKTYLRVISEQIVEREGGVCIKNFGYWFNWKPPKKMESRIITNSGVETTYSFNTDHHLYFPTFWATDKFIWWSMDKTFNYTLKQRLKEKICGGKTYKMYLSSMKQMKYLSY